MSEWPLFALGEIFDIARGGSPRPIQDFITEDPRGINWIMISDATESSKYITQTKKRIKISGTPKSRMVHPGDFLLTNSMSFGRPYIMRTSGCIHDGWLVLRGKQKDVIDRDFFYHLLGSSAVYSEFERLAAGATVKNLNIDLVSRVKVPLPPVAEQRRIAAILDQADMLLRKRRQTIAEVDKLPIAVFGQMFGNPKSLPNGWSKVTLQDVIRDGDRINYGVVQPGTEDEGGIPLVRVANIVNQDLRPGNLKKISPSIEGQYKRSRLRGDEVLVSCVGSIGAVALANAGLTGANIARAVARIPVCPDKANRIYIMEFLRLDRTQRYFRTETRTVAQPTLNIKQLSETPVFLPPLPIQEQFSNIVVKTHDLKSKLMLHLGKLEALFASLQDRAFRGELIGENAERELALVG